ncbi:junctional cadherin 5-associated protein [Hyla sarda]|uniref:junctional cadherin 5-associated protein n=1 Tax=Hyla sarda TaxID=327740 RepID=UPI0024C25BA1|nr:junctional cadherin 5-associated protein [Hyla sarda]XP_056375399.1 junctional cadherin 5-associated protein [Hyla sarda]XP_056375400.1 junctional cadherin 5-associated protein [Hyla sarda]XP_056375401.1 junctional cadherin 5-associated protein [Hyla sarda]
MFSVEDLLVSHGYRVSKSTLSSYQHRTDDFQHEAVDAKSGNGVLNGYPPDLPDTNAVNPATTKGLLLNDHEKCCVNKRRQTTSAGYPRSAQSTATCQTTDTGVPERLQTEKPCWARTDKDIQYWRRRGQDFSVLLNHGGNRPPGENIALSTDIEGKRKLNFIDKNTKEFHNIVTENVDKVKQKVRVSPKSSESQMSDGSSEKLEFTPPILEEGLFFGPNKQKSQLMLKVSPEGPCHMAISSTTGDGSFVKENKIPSQDKYVVQQDFKSSFLKPKYSRPSKPPSYEVHQQTWGAVDVTENQDYQQKEEHHSSPKALETLQESCSHDSGMEPPHYIPPPSYKSPPLLHAANQPYKKVPRSSDCIRQNISVEKSSTSDKKPTCCLGNNGPFTKPANYRHSERCKNSVQYISFDDPRIKHIAAAQEAEKHNHSKKHNDHFRLEQSSQESNFRKREQDSAFINPRNACHHFVKREGIKHKQWLHISIPNQMCYPLSENRDGATACSLPEDSEPTHKLSLKKTHSDSACETVTKVKKFEPESFVFSKKSSKRKLNETIFCLVSIPVKADSATSDMSKSNNSIVDNVDRMNMLKHSNGGLHEQRLLSGSSSDLELQTLTGSMNNNTELLKQAQSKTEENKQANDLRSGEQRKHKELTYSGSWPGDQYKDQQTQTVITDIPIPPLYNGEKESELENKSQFVPTGALGDPRRHPENARPNILGMKGQVSFTPSTNSAFSRTSLLLTQIPRPEPCQRCDLPNANVDGKEKMVKCEKNEFEEDNPCNKKEIFGQFLLKPVNRRPWDAISELESMNKEFQDQDSCTTSSEGEKSIVKEQSTVTQVDFTRTALRREMLSNNRHIIEIEEVPMFDVLQDQSKLDSWCTEKLTYDISEVGAELCKSSKIIEVKNKAVKLLDGCLMGETQAQTKKVGDKLAANTGAMTKSEQEQPEQIHASKTPNNKKQLSTDVGLHHFKEDKTCFDHTFFDIVKVSCAKFGQLGDNMIRKLSLSDRNHGRSVPDLSKQFISTNHNGDFYEEHNYLDIPENESLHERAARILGIDVADDCLVSNGSSEAQSPENVLPSSALPPDKSIKEKKVSEFFFPTKETTGVFKSILHLPLDNEKAAEKLKNIVDLRQDPPFLCQSVSEHSETNVTRSAEKRVRNPSKKIETLQGKLASTPVRTALDRLARMKEVDSVSRMRRLSIKSTDSGDELDEEKQFLGMQDGRTRKFSTGSIYKRVISLDESLLLTPKGKERLDLSCTDAYDPARVERV